MAHVCEISLLRCAPICNKTLSADNSVVKTQLPAMFNLDRSTTESIAAHASPTVCTSPSTSNRLNPPPGQPFQPVRHPTIPATLPPPPVSVPRSSSPTIPRLFHLYRPVPSVPCPRSIPLPFLNRQIPTDILGSCRSNFDSPICRNRCSDRFIRSFCSQKTNCNKAFIMISSDCRKKL
jgi:hypothetical protein